MVWAGSSGVEHGTENAGVGGSIPPLPTISAIASKSVSRFSSRGPESPLRCPSPRGNRVNRTASRSPTPWPRWLLTAGLSTLAGCAEQDSSSVSEPEVLSSSLAADEWPNVLLVSLDTTRADALGCYGSDLGASPVIDSLAAESIVFDHAFTSVPVTLPAHATLLTGLRPPRHGVRDNAVYELSPEAQTITEALRETGYRTFAVVAAVVLDRSFGLGQGFDVYDQGALDTRGDNPHQERPAQEITDAALAQLSGSQPWFGFVHFYDPHQPFTPPDDLAERYSDDPRNLYYAEIASVDRELGRLFQGLKDLGLWQRTLIVLTADHGEGRGEHGEVTHGHLLHDATQRVPLILRDPRREPGRIRDRLVTLEDVAPTLLELALGAARLPSDGKSLVACLDSADATWADVAYMETLLPWLSYDWAPLTGIRTLEWKLVEGSRTRLFHLSEDSAETTNVAERHPDVVERLQKRLADLQAGPSLETQTRVVSAEEMAVLGGLGYVSSETPGPSIDHGSSADPYEHVAKVDQLQLAQSLMQQKNFDEALRLLRDLEASIPQTFLVHQVLGSCLGQMRDFEGALEASRRAAEIRPESATAQFNIGLAAYYLENLELARERLEHAVTLPGCPTNAYFRLYEIYGKQGDALRARAIVEALLAREGLPDSVRRMARELLP